MLILYVALASIFFARLLPKAAEMLASGSRR